MRGKSQNGGFTIVELLIVIVVIAILAAITIVAFNGVQDRARSSSASQAATQSAKKVKLWQVEKEGQSPTCTDFFELLNGTTDGAPTGACIFDFKGTNYQYTPSTTVAGGYCVTATVSNRSYKMSETGLLQSGGCGGHGSGGVLPIANLAMNPSLETNGNWWAANWGTGGAGSLTRLTNGGASGSTYIRGTWTTAPTSGTTGGVYYNHPTTGQITEGSTYTASAFVRPSKSQRMQISIYWINTSGVSVTTVAGTSQIVNSGTWSRLSVTGAAPAGTVRYFVVPFSAPGTGFVQWAVGDTVDVDSVMLSEGSSLYEYADGSSQNWAWGSAVHNSTSSGMAL